MNKEKLGLKLSKLAQNKSKIIEFSAKTIGSFLDKVRLEIKGVEYLEVLNDHLTKNDGGAIVLANHESIADYLIFRTIRKNVPKEIEVVAPWAEKFMDGEMGMWGLIGQALGAMDQIELLSIPQEATRANTRKLYETILRMRQVIREGNVVCFFPQGTRSRTVGMSVAKTGLTNKLFDDEMIKDKTMIVPIAVRGTRNIHEPNTHKINPLAKVHLSIGKPEYYRSLEEEAKELGIEITDLIMWKIGQMLPVKYEGAYQEKFTEIRNKLLSKGNY